MTDREQIEALIVCRHPCLFTRTVEERYVLELLTEIAIDRGLALSLWSISQGVRDGLVSNGTVVPDTENPAAALYHVAYQAQGEGIFVFLDLSGHLKDERALRMLREAINRVSASGGVMILIDAGELPAVIRASAAEFRIDFPEEQEIAELIRASLRQVQEQHHVQVDLSKAELQALVRNLRGLSRRQARQIILEAIMSDRRLDSADVNNVLLAKRRAIGGEGLLEFIDVPVTQEEIGGLAKLKQWLGRRHDCFCDEAAAFGLPPPRGILMLGVQGAGKSLAAKAVATAWRQPLLRMDAGAIYDRYIGESERRLREALQQAERMSPVILWIDEIEKGFASAASQSSDGGLSKRMFGHLLTWMQEHKSPVFLIATANDIEALPPELLRKGRFDEIFFVDLPNLEARAHIAEIHLKKRGRDASKFDLGRIAESSDGYSGAEIEQAIISGLHDAFAAKAELTTDHVLSALATSPPLSTTMAEKVNELREWAKRRCVPAD